MTLVEAQADDNTAEIQILQTDVSNNAIAIASNTTAINNLVPTFGTGTFAMSTAGASGNLPLTYTITENPSTGQKLVSFSVTGYFVPNPATPNTVSYNNSDLPIPSSQQYVVAKTLGATGGPNFISSCTGRIETTSPFTFTLYTDTNAAFPLLSTNNVLLYNIVGFYYA